MKILFFFMLLLLIVPITGIACTTETVPTACCFEPEQLMNSGSDNTQEYELLAGCCWRKVGGVWICSPDYCGHYPQPFDELVNTNDDTQEYKLFAGCCWRLVGGVWRCSPDYCG